MDPAVANISAAELSSAAPRNLKSQTPPAEELPSAPQSVETKTEIMQDKVPPKQSFEKNLDATLTIRVST